MNVHLFFLMVLFILPYLSTLPPNPLADPHFSKNPLTLLVKNEEGVSPKEDSRDGPSQAIEEYEKEKLAKMKRNIGRRLLTVKTINPAVFYESPNDLERKLRVKREKEGFVIVAVVQNQSGTMNFYQIKFDSGETGYLSSDANNLEIKIKGGSLISVPKRTSTKKKSLSQSKALASQAVEMVKDHFTPGGSVEKKMMDEKVKSFPNLKWRYEAKGIGSNKYRVTQYAGEGAGPPLIRTWIVDLSTAEVKPENLAAKEMYR